jgi:hypothetical protein
LRSTKVPKKMPEPAKSNMYEPPITEEATTERVSR